MHKLDPYDHLEQRSKLYSKSETLTSLRVIQVKSKGASQLGLV